MMFPLLALAPFLLSKTVYGQSHVPETLCSLDDFVISIPSAQNSISIPQGVRTKFLAIGFGTQNYTCSNSGVYQSIGAVAELIDISCHVKDTKFSQFRKRDSTNDAWDHEVLLRAYLSPLSLTLGHHHFISNTVFKFDFTTEIYNNDPTAFITNSKIANAAAPNKAQDIDWAKLGHIDGELADFVIIFDTHFGQPPTKCTPGSPPVQVRYSAKYAFYKNSTQPSNGPSGTSKLGALNAALSSDTDPSSLQKLLNYAPAILGLLGVTTVLSLILVIFTVFSACRGRRNSIPTRSAAYRPIQLSRAKTPVDGSYHDDPEPYGS